MLVILIYGVPLNVEHIFYESKKRHNSRDRRYWSDVCVFTNL